MRTQLFVLALLFVILAVIFTAGARTFLFPMSSTENKAENDLQSVAVPKWFVIDGLVENSLNLTYAELQKFPLLSEVATLQCVSGPSITCNWTGVPLFYLLGMAKLIPSTYCEVVFNATDGFSSSIMLETAMEPTTILALKANGTDLGQVGGFGGGYRVVLPCRWGYKWVKWIKQIAVVDYDYKGTYEQQGYSDEAIQPNCTMPSTNPPLQTFNVSKVKEYIVQVLSNSSIQSCIFETEEKLAFNVSGPQGTGGYFYCKFSKELLAAPYQILVNGIPRRYMQIDSNNNTYLFFTYLHNLNTIEIKIESTDTLPIPGDVDGDFDVDIYDIVSICSVYGSNIGEPTYVWDSDINGDGKINIYDIVIACSHYGEGTT